MAMEIHVFSGRRLTSTAEWQQAIEKEGFPLRLSDATEFARHSGFLPAQLRGRDTGFEFYHDDPDELTRVYDNAALGRNWGFALGFRWKGDLEELQAAWMAATAYARVTSGVVFDPQEGRLYTAEQAAIEVRNIEEQLPAMKAALREMIKKFS
jgi:hypothetical protein